MATFDSDLLFPQSSNPAFAADARRASFEKMLPAIEAMSDRSLAPILIDVTTALGVVIAAVHNVQKLRPKLAELPDMPVEQVDELLDCVGALAYANSIYLLATKPQEPLVELSERGSALRARLHGDLERLSTRGLVPKAELANYVGTIGYKIIGADLMLLGDLAERSWSSIDGKSPITRDEIDAAKRIGFELVTAVGMRGFAQTSVAEATRLRLLTFNLLLRRYDALRRAVSYVRWDESDAEKFAPSLYAGRRRKDTSSDLPDAANPGTGSSPNEPATGANPDASTATADDAFES